MAKKILLCDDEPEICELVSESLKELGYEIFSANTGQAALDMAQKTYFDLFVLDIFLPDIDGVVIYETLRKTTQYDRTPFIFLTALARGTRPQLAGLNDAPYSILPKPSSLEDIQKEVVRLLS
jgi:CheY-like chemotaxis protein